MVQGAQPEPDPARRRELSDILTAEYKAIREAWRVNTKAGDHRSIDVALDAAADEARARNPPPSDPGQAVEQAKRKLLYKVGYQLNLNALCLSGGGIRSAAVSFGIIQALVDRKLLRHFDYLSTVSGGGYIGSWLSAWLYQSRNPDGTGDADAVLDALSSVRANTDREPPPIAHLRRYSNYLTPSVGLFSADTATAVVMVLRNILINWTILLPFLTLLVAAMNLLAWGLKQPAIGSCTLWVSLACIVFVGLSLGYKLYHLYSLDVVDKRRTAQRRFLIWSLVPTMASGFCFAWLARQDMTPAQPLVPVVNGWFGWTAMPGSVEAMIILALVVYAVALVVGVVRSVPFNTRALPPALRRRRFSSEAIRFWFTALPVNLRSLPGGVIATTFGSRRLFAIDFWDFICWALAAVAFAAIVWIDTTVLDALPGYIILGPHDCATQGPKCVILSREMLIAIFALPAFMLSTILAHTIYLLLRSGSREGDVEREWLGRASGWHFIAMIAWIVFSAIVLLGPLLYQLLGEDSGKWLSGLTAASGTVTGFLGKSGLTPAQGKAKGKLAISATMILAIVGPAFAGLLLILIAVVIGQYAGKIGEIGWFSSWNPEAKGLVIVLLGAAVIMFTADSCANINAFSLHAIYRNRLVRAFLGGARAARRLPDGFTDFDWDDDLKVAALWNEKPPTGPDWRPFHVINMTLNLSKTNELAWQQRKAMPFTVTPLSCGNADLGYRPTEEYAGPPRIDRGGDFLVQHGGISLGTAIAISGAAVSSNMGYYSSKPLSFLLTFFNVRLGCWLGNPGEGGGEAWFGDKPYRKEGPRFALVPLLKELFGVTSDTSAYVNLSDGGHFEDLGLYEMVRRRCRFIVVCDGDEDAERGFEDLGNAVRKIWIDLGVRISFTDSPLLQATKKTKAGTVPYYALGKIEYVSDAEPGQPAPTGQVLYIKPTVRGDEAAADIIAYKRANPAFPDQSTADQWFDEPRLESHRRLGHLMTDRLIEPAAAGAPLADLNAFFAGLAQVNPATMKTGP